jgi:hypothetical protein
VLAVRVAAVLAEMARRGELAALRERLVNQVLAGNPVGGS